MWAVRSSVAARGVTRGRFVVCDVALFYAERSGGIRTYLNEKARFAAASGAFEHHLVVPGRRERHRSGRHELRSLQLAASNGYRIPLGSRAVRETLRAVRPDIVILHDPFWRPLSVTREGHRLGAAVVAVHHASPALHAAGIPGPDAIYLPTLRRIYQHAYEHVDAVMSTVDTKADSGRSASIKLRFGVHPAFRPGPALRGDHLLYVGRVSLEKRIVDVLEAMAIAGWGRPLHVVGDGPARPSSRRGRGSSGSGTWSSCARLSPTAARSRGSTARPRASSRPGRTRRSAWRCSRPRPAARGWSRAPRRRRLAGREIVTTFTAKDPGDLVRAIDRALASPPDPGAAAALGEAMSWERVFESELTDYERLCR